MKMVERVGDGERTAGKFKQSEAGLEYGSKQAAAAAAAATGESQDFELGEKPLARKMCPTVPRLSRSKRAGAPPSIPASTPRPASLAV